MGWMLKWNLFLEQTGLQYLGHYTKRNQQECASWHLLMSLSTSMTKSPLMIKGESLQVLGQKICATLMVVDVKTRFPYLAGIGWYP